MTALHEKKCQRRFCILEQARSDSKSTYSDFGLNTFELNVLKFMVNIKDTSVVNYFNNENCCQIVTLNNKDLQFNRYFKWRVQLASF